MRRITNVDDLRLLGDVLFVGAHPDDEVFCAGGIMAACVRAGQRVGGVIATRGEDGDTDGRRWPKARLGEIRTQEAKASLDVLGVSELRWLKYRDGQCGLVDEGEAASTLWQEIDRFKPDTILTFGPDGLTWHPDHQAVGHWTKLATKAMNVRVLWAAIERDQYEQLREADDVANIFYIDMPILVDASECAINLGLPDDLADLKRQAFQSVPSQFETLLTTKPFDKPGVGLARECFIEAKGGE